MATSGDNVAICRHDEASEDGDKPDGIPPKGVPSDVATDVGACRDKNGKPIDETEMSPPSASIDALNERESVAEVPPEQTNLDRSAEVVEPGDEANGYDQPTNGASAGSLMPSANGRYEGEL